MKKTSVVIFMVLICSIILKAQDTLTQKMLIENNVSRMKYYEVYIKDDLVVKVGDTLKIGDAIAGKYFSHIEEYDVMGGKTGLKLDAQYSGNMCIIKRIYCVGSDRAGWSVYMQFKGPWALSMYYFAFEPAVSSGEIIIPNYYTSDSALSELKKAKEKLDLGLITQEDYEKRKAELLKYIK